MNDTEKPAPEQLLTPAHDNVWYWLATLYGEQNGADIDDALAEMNRAAWLRWFAPPNNSKLYAALEEKGFSGLELTPFTETERRELLAAYAKRLGRDAPLSQPSLFKPVDFCNTHFECTVSFRGFLFASPTDFAGAKFSGGSYFDEATFSEFVYFSKTEFNEVAYFRKTMFFMRADFLETEFFSLATFHKATFSGLANFNDAKFSGEAYFQRAKFSEEANFREAKFSKRANFINAEFCSETVFAGVTFVTSVPDFRGAKLHEATEWHGVSWPEPEIGGKYQDQVYAYERLRQEMERLKKPDDELSFVRKEFRAKRGLLKPWRVEWLLNCSYEFLSDYGNSIVRPMVGLMVLFMVGMLLLFLGGIPVFCPPPVFAGTSMTILDASAISFTNIFSIFPGVGKIMSAEHPVILSGAFKLFSVAQFIFGALLFLLLGLALRNRFRLK